MFILSNCFNMEKVAADLDLKLLIWEYILESRSIHESSPYTDNDTKQQLGIANQYTFGKQEKTRESGGRLI